MSRAQPCTWGLRVALVVFAALALVGCLGVGIMGPPVGSDDEGLDWGDGGLDEEVELDTDAGDGGVDNVEDPPIDGDAGNVAEEEVDAEPEDDGGPEIEEDAGPPVCSYPTGPYDFNVDGTVEPMSWPGAVSVGSDGGVADFEELHCDSQVDSIFLYVGNTT